MTCDTILDFKSGFELVYDYAYRTMYDQSAIYCEEPFDV